MYIFFNFLCHVRVMNVNSICDDNDDAFQRYNFFKRVSDPLFYSRIAFYTKFTI